MRSRVEFFELRIGRRNGHCYAQVVGPDFEAEAELELDDFSSELGALASQHLRLRQLSPADDGGSLVLRERADAVGRRLSSRVFEGQLGRSFEERRRAAEAGGRRLVLRLRLEPDPRLLAFPWEVLFGPGGRKPLAINEQTPLVRSLALPQPVEQQPTFGPLKVLVAEASPPGWPVLAAGEEIRRLESCFVHDWWSSVELKILRAATVADLEKAVETFRPQVVHFIGHGDTRTEGGEPCLVFAGQQGGAERVDGQRLAALLDLGSPDPAARSIRLVVLNACRSGESLAGDAFAGVAPRLVQQGVSAVVAMRYPISDAAAIACSERLYQDLAAGRSVDQAMSRARRRLYGGFDDLSWLAPVLFLRGEEGRILSRRPRRSTIAAGLLAAVAAASLALWLAGPEAPLALPPLPAEVLTDHARCPSPKDLVLGLALVDPGSFDMGADRSDNASPRHRVTLTEPFCLARTELTAGQWDAIMGSSATRQDLLTSALSARPDEGAWLPKGGISYEAATKLIARLNELAGADVFFLSSEAQWEYAARADSAGAYSFGDNVALLRRYSNCGPKSDDGFEGPARVASFRRNDWGFYDMQGNLTEWVSDWYSTPYPPGPLTDPTGPPQGHKRIRRGGSYGSVPEKCEVSFRVRSEPEVRGAEYGLRVARWPEPPASQH